MFEDTEVALRAPMFLALPVLGIVTYLLARRWLGVIVSFSLAALLLVNSWTVNNALQLKSYSYEGILAVATVALVLALRRTGWGAPRLLLLYTALGLTAVFSLPNLFVLAPLLLADLVTAIRSRDRTWLRIAGEGLAGVIALVHYALFVRPQAAVAGTAFWQHHYAPHQAGALVRFTLKGLQSFDPLMVTGVSSAANSVPAYTLPAPLRVVLALGILLLLAAGLWAAIGDATARLLVIALGGALVLELAASAVQRWPFGMVRVNIFMLPLFYILGGIGLTWLVRVLAGRPAGHASRAGVTWWRAAGLGAFAVALAATVVTGGIATGHALAETSQAQRQPTEFTGVKAAVQQARSLAGPGDLAIIRAYRTPAFWYGEGWLYYMHSYQGDPPSIARLPTVAASDTTSVFVVTPASVGSFMAAHPGSRAVFLLEFNIPGGTFPRSLHQESLQTLRRYGYCPVREFAYKVTGHMTVLDRAACRRAG
jgi:hypothetical protein